MAAKNARRAELVSVMRQLASYVTVTSNGDWRSCSRRVPYQKPSAPVWALCLRDRAYASTWALSGQLDASISPVYGAGRTTGA